MAILINDNYSLSANKAFDARYLDVTTPWADCAAAIAGIPTYRYQGLTVNIAGEEYWWKDGLTDGDLVPKALGGTSNLSGATNGLQLLCGNTYVGLGGILTQDTTICGAQTLNFGNSISGLTALCGVSPIFHVEDDGANSSINFIHDQDTPHFDVCLYGENADSNAEITLDVDVTNGCFIASTAPNTTCCSSLSLLTTDNNVAIFNVHSSNSNTHYIKESCIGSTELSCEAIINRSTPALNIKTIMNYDNRSHNFISDDATILSVLSGGTARYGSNVTISNDCDLVHKYYVDNIAGSISASNGLTRVDDNITLGGTLTGDTIIDGNDNYCLSLTNLTKFNFNSTQNSLQEFRIDPITQNTIWIRTCQDGTTRESYAEFQNGGIDLSAKDDSSDTMSMFMYPQAGYFCVKDNVNNRGIEYGGDYEDNFVARSLATAQYVTGLTSTSGIQTVNNGLTKSGTNVHLGGDLTGNTTINGVSSHHMVFSNMNDFSAYSSTNTLCATTSLLLRTPDFTLHNGVNDVMLITSSCNILTDNTNSEGFVYADDYSVSGSTNPRWIPDNAYVTGLTTGSVSTASNGLTLTLGDVKLGGTLTENTDICLGTNNLNIENSGVTTHSLAEFSPTTINLCAANVNSPFQISRLTADANGTVVCNGFADCYSSINMANSLLNMTICGGASNASFTVTDDSSTPRGIEYTADYSGTFSDCSLITKEYSDSGDTATLASGKTYTDNCALITLNSGKTYTDNCAVTTLSSANTYTDNCALITLNSGKTYTDNCATTTLSSANTYTDNCATTTLSSANTYTDNCTGIILDISTGYTDTCAATTLSSANTYTDNCTLITLNSGKTYTDNCVAACTITVNNGLTKTGQNVGLGGELTGNTSISANFNYDLCLGTTVSPISTLHACGDSGVCMYAGAGGRVASIQLNTCEATLQTYVSPSNYSAICIDENAGICIDFSGTTNAMFYGNDYSSLYTARSIPDVGWVTGQTSSSGIHSANNGLTKVGTAVKLGGTLSENTSITGNTLLCIGVSDFDASATNIAQISGDRGSLYLDICETKLSSCNDVSNFSEICLNQQGIKVTVCGTDGHMFYANDYSSTYDARSIVDKGYIDSQSNVAAVCQIDSAYTTLRNDELITVSGLSSNEISLYATPVLGQKLTVVDICGNALADSINVNGNGKNINDGVCSTINTDYGSITYIYNGIFWSAVAFIN